MAACRIEVALLSGCHRLEDDGGEPLDIWPQDPFVIDAIVAEPEKQPATLWLVVRLQQGAGIEAREGLVKLAWPRAAPSRSRSCSAARRIGQVGSCIRRSSRRRTEASI